jgi:O-methyltransferase
MPEFSSLKNYTISARGYLRAKTRQFARFLRKPMEFPPYSASVREQIEAMADDVRYAALALAIHRLETEGIEGSFAELGVYQGLTSRFIHQQAPGRRLYLFDTFGGFPAQAREAAGDRRFRDTSEESVAKVIGDSEGVCFRPGYFPESAVGLEEERFALVMLDFDLYQSAKDGFEFFYPRLVRGGYFFMHDFNSPESNHAISRAASEYLQDKPEMVVEIPDQWGSAVFRKI